MTRWRRIAVPLAVTFVVGYLAVMVISGEQPRQRQFVEFEAKGVLKTPPEQVRRVDLVRADQRVSVLRQGDDDWATPAGAAIDGAVAKQISTAVRMMHNSGPAREIPADDVKDTDPAEFGLDVPRITASFYVSATNPVLTVHFGARNPDEFLQYMRIDNDDHLYLMSRFIGEAWLGAFDGSLPR
ncbi:MAG TPA: hypothetical protein VNW90_09490 [Acetobacteraceae bacterium]|jgi:hypothetical protein|nr:hypothetical protein [Acetobacteraceae bacterium]